MPSPPTQPAETDWIPTRVGAVDIARATGEQVITPAQMSGRFCEATREFASLRRPARVEVVDDERMFGPAIRVRGTQVRVTRRQIVVVVRHDVGIACRP